VEHRWSERTSSQQTVIVDCPRIGLTSVNMHDVSLGGMFVVTNERTLRMNMPVVVIFNLAPSNHFGDFDIEAMVVRRTAFGAGLMFLDMATDVLRALQTVLYRAPKADVLAYQTTRSIIVPPSIADEPHQQHNCRAD